MDRESSCGKPIEKGDVSDRDSVSDSIAADELREADESPNRKNGESIGSFDEAASLGDDDDRKLPRFVE